MCEARGINPFAYLADFIPRVRDHPERRSTSCCLAQVAERTLRREALMRAGTGQQHGKHTGDDEKGPTAD
jgi:hypothetical protein